MYDPYDPLNYYVYTAHCIENNNTFNNENNSVE